MRVVNYPCIPLLLRYSYNVIFISVTQPFIDKKLSFSYTAVRSLSKRVETFHGKLHLNEIYSGYK